MSKWSVAHRLAQMAAVRILDDGGQPTDRRIHIAPLLHAADLRAVAEPADQLFGTYFPPENGNRGGVWLNSTMSPVDQRHTAAHELGHHTFNHALTCDTDLASLSAKPGAMDLTEATAEAFAAWLLMPRAALLRALTVIGATPQHLRPEPVYQVALQLGTSYKGTARHLGVAHIIDGQDATALARAVPGKIKNSLDDPTAPLRAPKADVWDLRRLINADELTVHHGDRIVLPSIAEQAADTLLCGNAAEFIHHGITAIVLTARAAADRADTARSHRVSLPGSENELVIRVEAGPLARKCPRAVPNVANLGEAELNQLLAAQQTGQTVPTTPTEEDACE